MKLHGMGHKQEIEAQQQPAQSKPPSESINYADLPPDGQMSSAKAGIQLNPTGLAMKKTQEISTKAANRSTECLK